MLPQNALTHFQHLREERLSALACSLDAAVHAFNRKETGGRGIGYVARLAGLYRGQVQPVATAISRALQEVHTRFNLGLSEVVQQEILDVAERSLQTWISGMEGAYSRHLGRYGIAAPALDWGLVAASAQASLLESLRRYFWNLEHLPPMPQESSSNTVININAPGAVVQTGANAVAHVRQGSAPADVAALLEALAQFGATLKVAPGVPAEIVVELQSDLSNIVQEVQTPSPSSARVGRWLGGIGASVQTVASLQPAWQAVQAALKVMGL